MQMKSADVAVFKCTFEYSHSCTAQHQSSGCYSFGNRSWYSIGNLGPFSVAVPNFVVHILSLLQLLRAFWQFKAVVTSTLPFCLSETECQHLMEMTVTLAGAEEYIHREIKLSTSKVQTTASGLSATRLQQTLTLKAGGLEGL